MQGSQCSTLLYMHMQGDAGFFTGFLDGALFQRPGPRPGRACISATRATSSTFADAREAVQL